MSILHGTGGRGMRLECIGLCVQQRAPGMDAAAVSFNNRFHFAQRVCNPETACCRHDASCFHLWVLTKGLFFNIPKAARTVVLECDG
jgi:hypothetical protein